jgi:hypothetical protein
MYRVYRTAAWQHVDQIHYNICVSYCSDKGNNVVSQRQWGEENTKCLSVLGFTSYDGKTTWGYKLDYSSFISHINYYYYFRKTISCLNNLHGTCNCSWLRHYATSQRVTGLIPDEIIGFFNWPNPSSCTMALGLTQPLTQMITRNPPEG